MTEEDDEMVCITTLPNGLPYAIGDDLDKLYEGKEPHEIAKEHWGDKQDMVDITESRYSVLKDLLMKHNASIESIGNSVNICAKDKESLFALLDDAFDKDKIFNKRTYSDKFVRKPLNEVLED